MYRCNFSIVLPLLFAAACGDNTKLPAEPDAPHSPDAPPASADASVDAPAGVDFTETFGVGTQDTGDWILTSNPMRPRMIDTTGGNPDGYLYGEVATSIPTWYTESTHYDPGTDDAFKRDSVFVGDYYTAGIKKISVDLDVIQPGAWTSDRTVTLELRSWDATDSIPGYQADFSMADMDNPPTGWNHYDFTIDAQSTTIPAGWTLLRPDGSPGTDADWATLMHSIDFVGFGYWKPGFGYPSFGSWNLGIDNIAITAR